MRLFQTLMLIFPLSGCSVMSEYVSERSIDSALRNDGVYVNVEIRTSGNVRDVSEVRLRKDEKKLNFRVSRVGQDGERRELLDFDSRYFVSCRRQKCSMSFVNNSGSMAYDFRLDVDKSGNISRYRGGELRTFEFMPD